MAISGLSSLEREEYICRDDPCKTEEDGATVFYLKNIPNNITAKISDMASAQQVSMTDAGVQSFVQRKSAKFREAFRYGVGGWQNFPDKEGNPIVPAFEQSMEGRTTIQVLTDATMDKIPLSIVNEVGEAVFNKNSLTEAQKKKYDQLSSLFADGPTSPVETATPGSNEIEDALDAAQSAANTGKTPPRAKSKTKKAS